MKIIKTLVILLVFTTIGCQSKHRQLPIYNPASINPKLVDPSMQAIDINHTVSDFSLINQNGKTITQEDYRDKIYVKDFFFTRCQTICPVMTNNMGKLQEAFLNDDDVKLLSISVTPALDSVRVLKEYANKKGVKDLKWNITTGNKKHIYNLARKSYFAVVDQGDGGLQDFIHTTHFILVDTEKQIRGIYDGTNDDEIEQLIQDITLLKN